MSYDWTKDELSAELNERFNEGEAKEKIFNFIWAIIDDAYKERDTAIKELYQALESYVLMVAETASGADYEEAKKHPLLKRYCGYFPNSPSR